MTEMSRIERVPLTRNTAVEKELTCFETVSSWIGLNWCCHGITEEEMGASPFQDERACTDVVCCLSFLVLWGVMLIIYGSAFNEADIGLLLGSVNYQGKPCDTHQVAFAPMADDYSFLLCADNCSVTQSDILPQSYETHKDWRGVCVRDDAEAITIIPGWDSTWARTILDDIRDSWQALLGSVFVSLVLTMVFGLLIKYLACCVIVVSVVTITVGGIGTGYFLFTESGTQFGDTQRVFAYVIWFLVAVFLLLIFCMIQKIHLALEIIDAAVHVITDMMQLLCLPFLPMILGLVFMAFWMAGLLYIYASFGTLISVTSPPDLVGITIQGQYIDDTYQQYQRSTDWFSNTTWLCIFFLFVNLQFFVYFNYYVEAGAISEWYFSRYLNTNVNSGPKIRGEREDELSESPVCSAIWRFLRYNIGTVVFAATVIGLIDTIRVMIEYMQYQTTKDNCLVQCISKMLCCCIWVIDFINRHGLILCAMQGYAFCPGARRSSKLIWDNLARVAIVQAVGGLAVKVAILAVVGGTATFCVLVLWQQQVVTQMAIPVLAASVIAFVVSSLFLGVLDNAVDVVFLCYLVDEQVTNAEFAPEDLRVFLDKHADYSKKLAERRRGRNGTAGDGTEIVV